MTDRQDIWIFDNIRIPQLLIIFSTKSELRDPNIVKKSIFLGGLS